MPMSRYIRVMFVLLMGLALALTASSAGQDLSISLQPECLASIGVRELQDLHSELTGRTVSIGLIELCQPTPDDQRGYAFMPNLEHSAFGTANWGNFYFYDNPHRPVRYSTHASMIAGIILGDHQWAYYDLLGGFHYRGMLPQATVDVYETNWFIYQRVLPPAEIPVDNDVLSISWGTDSNDAVTMWWQRGIDALAVRDKCVVVAGCGNGTDEFHSISKPSWGCNVISVGTARSLGTFPDSLCYLGPPAGQISSSGPTEDGRAKPDIIAPGLTLGPSGQSAGAYDCDRAGFGYSSFAAPQVAGAAALLIDAARQNNIDGADDPRLVKALLLNGADKLVGWHKGNCDPNDDHDVPLDYRQGAGLVNVLNSYRQLMAGRHESVGAAGNVGWDLARLCLDPNEPDAERRYYMAAPLRRGTYFKATLSWYRRYEQNLLFSALPLEMIALELWSVDEQGRLVELLDYSASRRDNLQHIYYQCQRDQQVALVVRAEGGSADGQVAYETCALAYCVEEDNWRGDQLAGDFNADGIVNIIDLEEMLQGWSAYNVASVNEVAITETSHMAGDLNGDGRLDVQDFTLFAEQWKRQSDWYDGKGQR